MSGENIDEDIGVAALTEDAEASANDDDAADTDNATRLASYSKAEDDDEASDSDAAKDLEEYDASDSISSPFLLSTDFIAISRFCTSFNVV